MFNMVENRREERRKSAICRNGVIRNPPIYDKYRDISLFGLPD